MIESVSYVCAEPGCTFSTAGAVAAGLHAGVRGHLVREVRHLVPEDGPTRAHMESGAASRAYLDCMRFADDHDLCEGHSDPVLARHAERRAHAQSAQAVSERWRALQDDRRPVWGESFALNARVGHESDGDQAGHPTNLTAAVSCERFRQRWTAFVDVGEDDSGWGARLAREALRIINIMRKGVRNWRGYVGFGSAGGEKRGRSGVDWTDERQERAYGLGYRHGWQDGQAAAGGVAGQRAEEAEAEESREGRE
jgi:hypothetical protein